MKCLNIFFIFCIGCFVGPRNLSLNKKKGKQIVQLEDEDEDEDDYEDEDEDEDEQIQDQEVEDDEGSEDLLPSDTMMMIMMHFQLKWKIEFKLQNGCYLLEIWIRSLFGV